MKKNNLNLKDLEKGIINNNKKDLLNVMSPLLLWIEEFKKSFASIFWNWKWDNMISISMDKFEKKWQNDL